MLLSLITPIKHLKWARLLPARFCIATIAERNKQYAAWFSIGQVEEGRQVILDNGVFEGSKLSDTVYLSVSDYIRPTILVAPDTINAPAEKNWDAACDFHKLFAETEMPSTPHSPELMFVPQCEKGDYVGFKEVLHKVITDFRFPWIGICRDAVYNAFSDVTHTDDQELNRFYFSCWLQRKGLLEEAFENKKHFHFLGVGDALWMLKHHWYVASMDTASLFTQAAWGNTISPDGRFTEHVQRPPDYFYIDLDLLGPESDWQGALRTNCKVALKYAHKAEVLRRNIMGGRI